MTRVDLGSNTFTFTQMPNTLILTLLLQRLLSKGHVI